MSERSLSPESPLLHSAEDEVRAAREEFDRADQRYEEALRIWADLGPTNSDGAHGLRLACRDLAKATTRYANALAEWARVLRYSKH